MLCPRLLEEQQDTCKNVIEIDHTGLDRQSR